MSNEKTLEQKKAMLGGFLYDIQAVENKIAAELTKIVVHADGKIDLNNRDFKDLKKSFMHALSVEPEPGKPAISVMSFAEVSRSIRGKLAKTSNGFTNEERAEMEATIEAKEKMLNDHLSTESHIQLLVTQDLKTQAIANLALKDQDGREYKEPQERIMLENSIKKAWLLDPQINTLLTQSNPEFATTTLKNILQKHTKVLSANTCEVDITSLNLDIQNLIAAGVSRDVTRLSTNEEKQAFGKALAKTANIRLKLPEQHIAVTGHAISQCDIPVIFLEDKDFRRSLSGKIAQALERDKKNIHALPEDIKQAFNEHASEYLIEKLVKNAAKEATPKQKDKQSENLTKIILKSKIPLTTLADPEFQKAISDQISPDGKVDAKKLKVVLDVYSKRPALARSTSEQPLQPSTQQMESPPQARPLSAPPHESSISRVGSVKADKAFFAENLGEKQELAHVILKQIDNIVRERAPHSLGVDDDEASNFHTTLKRANLSADELSDKKIQQEIASAVAGKIVKEITSKGTAKETEETLSVEDIKGIIDRVRVESKASGKVGKEEVGTIRPIKQLDGFDHDAHRGTSTDVIHVKPAPSAQKPHVQTAKVTQKPLEAKTPSPNVLKPVKKSWLATLGAMLKSNKVPPLRDSQHIPPIKIIKPTQNSR